MEQKHNFDDCIEARCPTCKSLIIRAKWEGHLFTHKMSCLARNGSRWSRKPNPEVIGNRGIKCVICDGKGKRLDIEHFE